MPFLVKPHSVFEHTLISHLLSSVPQQFFDFIQIAIYSVIFILENIQIENSSSTEKFSNYELSFIRDVLTINETCYISYETESA